MSRQPRLCPNCPLVPLFLEIVKKESWTREPAEDTTVKICARMRALADSRNLPDSMRCPYYKGESLGRYLNGRRHQTL